jgi:hypothetical protein
MPLRTLTVLILLSAFTVSCAEVIRERPWRGAVPETEAEKRLCRFDKVYTPTMLVRHHDTQGRLFFGDVLDYQSFADKGETAIRSAEARPEHPNYVQKVRTDCRNKTTGGYYPCTVKVQVDLNDVGAVVRSNFSDPVPMALRLCSDAARQAWKEQVGFEETNASQRCVATARAICAFPPSSESETKTE